jgi:hypothetical protein
VTTHIGIGFSSLPDPAQAAKEAAVQAKNQMNTTTTHLVVVFSSLAYGTPEALLTIERILQPEKLIGSSTAGIIAADKISLQGIGILAIHSEDIHFGQATFEEIAYKDMRNVGFQLARDLNVAYNHPNRHALLFFADAALKNSTAFVHGVQEVLGSGFPIIGGISSDDFNFKKTLQYSQNKILPNAVTAVMLGGQATVALGSKHGWKPLGKPRMVDGCDGHIINTIDGKPAVHIYEEYFGAEAKNIKESRLGSIAVLYPLGIYLEEENHYLLRNAVDILDDGSIVCQGEVPKGSEVHLMIGSKDACKQAALDAAHEVREGLFGRQAKLILIFESMTRYKLLGRSAIQEIQIIKDVLGYTTPMIGMYCAGEVAPFQTNNKIISTYLQNESIVIVAFG